MLNIFKSFNYIQANSAACIKDGHSELINIPCHKALGNTVIRHFHCIISYAGFFGVRITVCQTQACHPGKRRLRFLGSIACWMRRFTWPPTLSTVPSSTPFSFSCRRSNTRSATLLKLWLSLHKHNTQSLCFEQALLQESKALCK